MEIILLGSGTAVPSPGRTPAAVLLILKGMPLLLDMGPGAVHKMAARGVDPASLQHIFLTHLHSDHTLDLVTFLQMNDSTPGVQRSLPVFLTGPVGTGAFYASLMQAYPGISPQTYPFTLRETGPAQFQLGETLISTVLSGHTPTSLCYRFDTPEGSLVYTGDCAASAVYDQGETLVKFCAGADVLISECSFPSGWPLGDHLNADAAGQLAARSGVGRLVLTHLYPPAAEVDLTAQICSHYTGPVDVAADGFTLTLPATGA